MKLNKLLSFACGFVTVCGGLSFLLMSKANIFTLAVCFLLFPVFCALCFFVYKRLRPLKIIKITAGIFAAFCSAFSIVLASRLVCFSGVLDVGFYAAAIVITALCALCFSLSDRKALSSTVLFVFVICFPIIVLTAVLSSLDTSFSPLLPAQTSFDGILPLAFFTFADVVFLFPLRKEDGPIPIIAGGSFAFFLFLIMTAVAISVLSPSLYYSLDTPILKLWQSTFIASFINKFEVAAVSCQYLLAAAKSGISLWYPVKTAGKKIAPTLTLFLLGICALISFL